MYQLQQNKFYTQSCKIVTKTLVNYNTVRKRDRCSKFDLGYYDQVNSLQLKSSVASKRANKHFWWYHLLCWHYDKVIVFRINKIEKVSNNDSYSLSGQFFCSAYNYIEVTLKIFIFYFLKWKSYIIDVQKLRLLSFSIVVFHIRKLNKTCDLSAFTALNQKTYKVQVHSNVNLLINLFLDPELSKIQFQSFSETSSKVVKCNYCEAFIYIDLLRSNCAQYH